MRECREVGDGKIVEMLFLEVKELVNRCRKLALSPGSVLAREGRRDFRFLTAVCSIMAIRIAFALRRCSFDFLSLICYIIIYLLWFRNMSNGLAPLHRLRGYTTAHVLELTDTNVTQ